MLRGTCGVIDLLLSNETLAGAILERNEGENMIKKFIFAIMVTLTPLSLFAGALNVEVVGMLAGGSPNKVQVVGNYAYVAAAGVLSIIDISDKANPRQAGVLTGMDNAIDIFISSGYAYVADDSFGLRIIDITDPTNPTAADFLDTPGSANGVCAVGNYAYVADYYSGLRIINIATPAYPAEEGFLDTPGAAQGVYVVDNYAYIADDTSGLRIINITDPSNPTAAGFLDTSGLAQSVHVV